MLDLEVTERRTQTRRSKKQARAERAVCTVKHSLWPLRTEPWPALPQVINPQAPQSPHHLPSTARAPWEQKWDQLGSLPSQSGQPRWREGITVTSKAAA